MYTLSALVLTGLLALAVGVFIGTQLIQRLSPARQTQRDMEKHMGELQQQQQSYQQEVSEHFIKTADLVSRLTDSYRDVHNHLAQGAQSLCDDEAGEGLQQIPELRQQKIEQTTEENLNPPLDYAPKTTPHEKGMLNEEFGLDKKPKGQLDSEIPPNGISIG